jgi:hypothetical protein
MIWYLHTTPVQFVFGILCIPVSIVIGRKTTLWSAVRTFKGKHPWSGEYMETWEWEPMNDWRVTAWDFASFTVVCILPGITCPVIFYNSVFLPLNITHFGLWLAVSVLGAFTVSAKKYAHVWNWVLMPTWSVTWSLKGKD